MSDRLLNSTKAGEIALQIAQQAVMVLAKWADPLTNKCPPSTKEDAVTQAKELLSWFDDLKPKPLTVLFDSVKFHQADKQPSYYQPQFIADSKPTIPYPQVKQPAPEDFNELKKEIQLVLNSLTDDDWQNLSLLTLILEKFGSFISFGEADVALVDMAKTTAAVAAALANHPQATELSLVAASLSGIQKFIYTISSSGALQSLCARSFYLELVTEEVVQQLLAALQLPRTNVIYAGGGNLYLLAALTEDTKKIIEQVRQQFNQWLLDEFQGKVFLALDCLSFPIAEIATAQFAQHWSNVTQKLAGHKSRKFAEQIINSNFIIQRDSYEPCRVCHRDDVEKLEQLNSKEPSVLACETCRRMFQLGGQLLQVEAIARSQQEYTENKLHTLAFKLPATAQRPAKNVYYHLFGDWKQIVPDDILLVNDWKVEHYRFRHLSSIPWQLGYGIQTFEPEENSFMSASVMAEQAKGIKRLGYLRMDVDRLRQIFALGLAQQTLPRLAGLSRQMSYFFKVYLKSLAENRSLNLPLHQADVKTLTQDSRLNLLFIYAGGDDLFVTGAWNEVVEFAFDVYQCFRAYTGHNSNMTLSGGITIADVKYPLYQAAREATEAQDAAKGNGNSLSLFNQVFKWDEWLGVTTSFELLTKEEMPKLLGILPFVKRWEQENIGINYYRNFVRNLQIAAQIQEQALKKVDKKSTLTVNNCYYLHLPHIAYTLAKLPAVLNNSDFRTSLKSPYNAPYFRAIATWIELLHC